MTFKEKAQQEHPEENIEDIILLNCPCWCGYEEKYDCMSTDIFCPECWNREIPEGDE